MPDTIIFKACKHLDFSDNYDAEKNLISNYGETKVCWNRKITPYEGAPKLVQFCKLRGRMNDPKFCLDEYCQGCQLYEEHTHTVKLDTINTT